MGAAVSDTRDVIILGGGLNGATLALALAHHGVTSHVVEWGDADAMVKPAFDGRTTAISSTSMAMFDAIGIGAQIRDQGCPIRTIWVSDQLKPGELDFSPDDPDDALGYMYENRVLRVALLAGMRDAPEIALHMPARAVTKERGPHGVTVTLDNGAVLKGALLVAAEGRRSDTRDDAGFKLAQWQYDHIAIVGAIYHADPHNNVAYEIFYPSGPFALLPMNDEGGRHRSAFVWSVPRAKAAGYQKLSDAAFLDAMHREMQGMLGDIDLAAPRMAYPLSFQHTAKVIGERLVLLGDAAHGIHPIAGQGLNLGLRDVATLAEVIVDGMRKGLEPGDAALLTRYERWRSLDVLTVAGSTDLLTHFFGLPGRGTSAVRRFGLNLVQRAPGLKRFFMGEARGTTGALPRLLQGQDI